MQAKCVQAGGTWPAQLRNATTTAIACIEPHMSDASGCRLGLDDTTAACFAENSNLSFDTYADVDMAARMCIVHEGHALRQVVIDIANDLGILATCHSFHRNSVYPFKCALLYFFISARIFAHQ